MKIFFRAKLPRLNRGQTVVLKKFYSLTLFVL